MYYSSYQYCNYFHNALCSHYHLNKCEHTSTCIHLILSWLSTKIKQSKGFSFGCWTSPLYACVKGLVLRAVVETLGHEEWEVLRSLGTWPRWRLWNPVPSFSSALWPWAKNFVLPDASILSSSGNMTRSLKTKGFLQSWARTSQTVSQNNPFLSVS